MLRIVLLAFGAAVFPALLACVAILISRPEPRRLILAFYLGGLLVSVASGIVVVRIFHEGGEIAGSSSAGPHGHISIVVGLVGMFFCWLLSSRRGRSLIDAWRDRHPRKKNPKAKAGPSWVEKRLSGASVRIAFFVGGAINLPGPFYLLALGDIANGYGTAEQLALILLFNAIMFLLLEVPLIGYLFDPEWTARAVAVSGAWLNANGLRILGALIGAFSISLLIQGIGTVL
ncbi:MAG: GAP family protein [Actinobacteria bacterium]|nr:GAP family protein [Actinomycetota bacterium]